LPGISVDFQGFFKVTVGVWRANGKTLRAGFCPEGFNNEHRYAADMSAAHSDVESSFETHDGLDVGHKTKRYIFMPKMGVVKPKGIFLEIKCK
jgi:hypothetical protein